MDLFDSRQTNKEPLAARMRPRNLDEYIGQEHIVGKGRLLRRAIAADQLTSVIFYGPPGTGKTTLARVIASHTKSNFITLNAVLTGVQNIREAIAQAEQHYKLYGRRTILFVDEVHRWNRSQQDALLPWVENGTIILVGATTENPFFEVNKALVSRSRVFQLKPLEKKHLEQAAQAALKDKERGYGRWKVVFQEGALEHLIETANGDARSLLNALELAVETTPENWDPQGNPPQPPEGSEIYISKEVAEESIQKKVVLYDRDGDYHYDVISAFIKSLRGRDPDAALYWLARMVKAGEDPHFIFRRMLISACEDTGLADPYALSVVESCAAAFDRVGLPEGRYHLAHATLYLATAPKSNSSLAFFDALSAVEKEDAEVPNHLKDGNRDAEGFGHGSGYMYPHAYKDHWVPQQYLPDTLSGRVFYNPSDQGYEKTIKEEVLSRRELQIAALLEEEKVFNGDSAGNIEDQWWQQVHKTKVAKTEEQLTFSPPDAAKEKTLQRAETAWQRRLTGNRGEILQETREHMLQPAQLFRHYRNFIWNIDDGLLLWECLRRSPEGVTAGVCSTSAGKDILQQYGSTLENIDRPKLTVLTTKDSLLPGAFVIPLQDLGDMSYDRLFFRDMFTTEESIYTFRNSLLTAKKQSLLAPGWKLILHQKIPCKGQHLGEILQKSNVPSVSSTLIEKMHVAENSFFTNKDNPLFSWDETKASRILAFGNEIPTSDDTDAQLSVSDEVQTGIISPQNFCTEDFYTISGCNGSGTNQKHFSVVCKLYSYTEKRAIKKEEIARWFAPDSSYGNFLSLHLTSEEIQTVKNALIDLADKQTLDWNYKAAVFLIEDTLAE